MSKLLIGSWRLIWAMQSQDGVKTHHRGENPVGQIIYSPDGRMSATIMDPSWATNEDQMLKGPEIFMAYAGPYTLEGDLVRHHVEICSWPKVIGKVLERRFEMCGNDEVFPRSIPITSKSGKTYQQELLWRRFGK